MRLPILTVLLAFALYLIYRYRGRPAAVNASVAAVRDLPSLLGQLQRTGALEASSVSSSMIPHARTRIQ